MSEERVDIVITDKVSDEPARKIKLIATNARDAHDAVAKLVAAVGGINSGAVAKLQKEMTSAVISTTQQATAYERLQAAQTRTATAVARLERAQNQANAAGAQASVVQQRLNTETERTEAASLRAATAREKLTQTLQRGASAVEQDGAAMVRTYQMVERERAKAAAAATQAGINAAFGIGQSPTGTARSSMGVFQQDAIEKAAAAKATADLERRTIALKSAIDPLFAQQQQLNRATTEANALLHAGAITQAEHAAAIRLATTALSANGAAQQRVQDLTKLTRFQVLTLQYTMNDIAASLASGASPFTILMQQGGQVTQAWGGLTNTLRAAGGAIATVTGVIVTAVLSVVAAIGTLAVGRKEFSDLQRQLDLTAGSAGVTAGQFMVMADSIAEASHRSVREATKVAEGYASTGLYQRQQIEQLSVATLNFAQLSGKSADDITQSWSKIAEGPARFTREFTMQYGVFSAAEYAHIKLLEDTGRKTEATYAVSKKLYDYYGQEVPLQLGYAERAWRAVSNGMSDAWTWLKRLGAPLPITQQLDEARAAVERLQNLAKSDNKFAQQKAIDELETAKQKVAFLSESVRIEKKASDGRAAEAQLQKDMIGDQEYYNGLKASTLDSQTKLNNAIAEYDVRMKRELASETALGAQMKKNRADAIKGFTEQFMPDLSKDAKKAASEQEKLELTTEAVFAALYKEADALGMLSTERDKANKLADIEIKLGKQKSQLTAAGRADAIALIDEIENQKLQQQALDAVYNASAGPLRTYQNTVRAITALLNAESISQAEATRQAVMAREAYTSATDPYKNINKSLRDEAELLKLVGDEKEVATKMQQYESELLSKGIELNSEANAQKKAELELAVRANIERARTNNLLAQYYNDSIGKAKALASQEDALNQAFARGYVGLDQYRVGLFNIAAEMASLRIEMGQGNFGDVLLVSVQKNMQGIEDALLETVMHGKADWKSLIDAMIKEALRLGVIKPLISNVLGAFGVGGDASGGGGIGGSLLNAGANYISGGNNGLMGLFTSPGGTIDNVMGAFGGGSGIGGSAATAAELSATADATSASLLEAGASAEEAATASEALAGSLAADEAATTGLTAALGSVPVYGWIALAALAIFSASSSGGGPKNEGGYAPAGSGLDISGIDIGGSVQGSQRGDIATAKQLSDGISSSLMKASQAFGVALDTAVGVFYAKDPEGTSQTQLQVVTKNYNRSDVAGGIENVGRDDKQFQEAVALADAQAVVKALQAAGLQGEIGKFIDAIHIEGLDSSQLNLLLQIASNAQQMYKAFEQLGPAFGYVKDMSVATIAALTDAAGGFDSLKAKMASYYDKYYSAEEKRVNTVKNITDILNAAGLDLTQQQVSEGTHAQFRALVESMDLTTSAGQRMFAALMSVADAFDTLGTSAITAATNAQIMADLNAASTDLANARTAALNTDTTTIRESITALDSASKKWRSLSQSLLDFKNSLLFSDLSPLTPKQQYEQAGALLDSTYKAAQGGDVNAMENLQNVINEFLKASQVYNASGPAYTADFNRVQDMLSMSINKSDQQAASAEAQLAIAQAQESSLQTINSSVLTVSQAIDNLAVAVRAALAAGLNPGAANLSALTGGVTSEWVDTPAGSIYTSPGGASATGGTIYAMNGQSYTMQQAIDYINGLDAAGRQVDAYYAFKTAGISLSDADKLMGWVPMTAENWATTNGYSVFADGGAFTNGIVSSPTMFNIGQMGEDGTEGILPLANIGGSLGVHATGMSNDALLERIDALVATVEELKEQHAESAKFIAAAVMSAAKANAKDVVSGNAKANKTDQFQSRSKANGRVTVKI